MKYTVMILIIVVIILNLYCGKLNYKLYSLGLTDSLSRISLKKIRKASNKVKTNSDKTLLRKCKVWYLLFLFFFYSMLLLAGATIFLMY